MNMRADHNNIPFAAVPGLGYRIAKIADLVGGKKNLARAIGISESQLYRYISGDSHPTVEPLAAIARCGSVRLDWLVLGEGPTGILGEINDSGSGYGEQPNYIQIDEYAEEGVKPVNLSAREIGKFSFNRLWLIKSGFNIESLRLIRAHGDAMAPAIDNGDLMIIDISQKKFNGDAFYLLRVDTRLLVAKRIQLTADNGLVIVNDNPAYRDQHIAHDQKNSLDIVGKIVWVGGLV
jgi:phage repressor protein C with HTH and peptisase S24 domain